MNLKHGHGYLVVRKDGGMGMIDRLSCEFCPFSTFVRDYRHAGDRSGQPRYNRARAAMIRHIHQQHRAAIAYRADPGVYVNGRPADAPQEGQ